MYPDEIVNPIRAEVRAMGLTELRTPEDVERALADPGPVLVFVNSICGCAAAGARPGLAKALAEAPKKPRVVTVFAGVDREATAAARARFGNYPPSSPSAALLKNGEVVWMLHRHQIEGRYPEQIAEAFRQAFAAHC
ncbi:MAG: BrxA/BrxB family bacilliredoxin [Planctomycetota bacterium]|nr:BrxA/BrxB family bacilliredoxin [Planctomycetota bacterium]